MEQTTLQQRIEERAKERLLKCLLQAYNKQMEIQSLLGQDLFPTVFSVSAYTGYSYREEITLRDDAAKEIFNKLLPNYIRMVTDEILQQIDQIKYLVENNESVEN